MRTWERTPGWGVVDRPEEGEHGGRLYAAALASGPVTVLDGPSAIVARAALAGHDLACIRDVLAAGLEVDGAAVDEGAVTELLADLVALGLLVPRGSSSASLDRTCSDRRPCRPLEDGKSLEGPDDG